MQTILKNYSVMIGFCKRYFWYSFIYPII